MPVVSPAAKPLHDSLTHVQYQSSFIIHPPFSSIHSLNSIVGCVPGCPEGSLAGWFPINLPRIPWFHCGNSVSLSVTRKNRDGMSQSGPVLLVGLIFRHLPVLDYEVLTLIAL